MNRKALFFDIDGTLLSERTHTIPDSALAALRKAREAGHLVFINSGRTRCLMQEVENGVPVDGYLCGCGTYIEIRGKKLLHRIIPASRRMEIQRAIVDHRLEGILEGVTGVSMQKGNSHLEAVERTKKILLNSRVLHEADWYEAPLDFDKFCVLEDAGSDAAGFLEFLKPDFSPIDRGGGLYECIPAGFSKATAMEYVLRYFGIPWEESYAFGDSSNDLTMLQYAKNAIVMEVHDRALESCATFITRKVEEDGIAYAMEQLNII